MRRRGRAGLRFYSFYLLTVADVPFVRLFFDGDQIKAGEANTECYVSRHIVNQEEVDIRVTFSRVSHLDQTLNALDQVHEFNGEYFSEQIAKYFSNPFATTGAAAVFKADLNRWIAGYLLWVLGKAGGTREVEQLLWSKGKLKIIITGTMLEDAQRLNSTESFENQELHRRTKEALKKLYRYDGPFEFASDIPF